MTVPPILDVDTSAQSVADFSLISESTDGDGSGTFNRTQRSVFSAGAIPARSSSSLYDGDAGNGKHSQTKRKTLDNSRSLSTQNKYDAFIANKFCFDKLGFFGRKEEQQVLTDAMERSCSFLNKNDKGAGSRELVLISGESGSGKTALAMRLKKEVNRTYRGRAGQFVMGKFSDQSFIPYSAISDVCSQICRILSAMRAQSSDKDHRYDEIRRQILNKLGSISEMTLLTQLVPDLVDILFDKNDTTIAPIQSDNNHVGNEQSKAQFLYLFRSFFRVVCQEIHPLVLVLDDVQWSDDASVGLIETLINDLDNSKLFLVCIYRSDEMKDEHLFVKMIQDVERKKQRLGPLQVSELTLGNLVVPVILELLLEGLDLEDTDVTYALAEVVHRRTRGNAFFVLRFLRRLWDEKLFTYNIGTNKCTWDIDEILRKTDAMTNVVELMKDELTRLPNKFQRRLSIAACVGNSLEPRLLNPVLKKMEVNTPQLKDTECKQEEGMRTEVKETEELSLDEWWSFSKGSGFIEEVHGSEAQITYQWIHDKVREGALSLFPAEELVSLKGEIGRLLSSGLSAEDRDGMIFVIANLLHEGPAAKDKLERYEQAKLNLEASNKAKKLSAFAASAMYAGRGVELLPDDRWESHNQALTLELLTIAAETEEMTGSFDLLESRHKEVFPRLDIPFSAKFDIAYSYLNALWAQSKLDEAVDLLLFLLEELGVKFPKTEAGRVMSMMVQLVTVKRKCQSLNMEKLLKLPPYMEETDLLKLKLLHSLNTFAYGAEKYKSLMLLGCFATTTLTLKCGISQYGPPNLASLGVVFSAILGDYKLGGKMGILAMNLLERYRHDSTDTWTTFAVYNFLRCWLDPLSSCQPHFMRAYDMGLRFGDTNMAMWNVYAYIVTGFQAGRPLKQLENDCRIYAPQMMEYGRGTILGHVKAWWLVFACLTGETEPLLDTDAGMGFDEFFEREKGNDVLLLQLTCMQSRLHAIFGEHESGAKIAIERGDHYAKQNPGLHEVMPETFARGLSLYAMAIETRKAKYRRHARRVHKTIRTWRKNGNPNVVHYENILKAENAAMCGRPYEAESLYKSAITIASRSGLIHDAALATERYGEMLLRQNSKVEAVTRLKESMKLYDEWGAAAKVEQLDKKYATLWNQTER